ncbi:helix-turn-helix domain-containing protein [Bradyrhizobium forestalis]|uniref:Helix-turn-helix domain-containing protein n=1 Tax=Bradyrhizobium forestalis TaxID=1419263 RepID=A0A2M8RCM1_9BRAD|nr:helix-turn-helix domain-containing protein [Bradyrhizobium forestalis]PJG55562.1 helix-turn-helix domain-containing protein [Bradyrhizobium forestalis]
MAVRAKNRQFPTAYKLKAIRRVERGEGVLPVARELGISRKILHDWVKAWKAHGPEGLNRKPGPKPGPRKLKPVPTYDDKRSALTRANARIAELERLVGRQQMDIDFFRDERSVCLATAYSRPRLMPVEELIQRLGAMGVDRVGRQENRSNHK